MVFEKIKSEILDQIVIFQIKTSELLLTYGLSESDLIIDLVIDNQNMFIDQF